MNNDEIRKKDIDYIATKINYGNDYDYLNKIDDNLKNDKEFWLELIKRTGFNFNYLKYFGKKLVDDKIFIMDVINMSKKNRKYYHKLLNEENLFLSEKIISDKEIILLIISKGYACIPKIMNNDKEIVLESIKVDAEALKYASEELKNDKEVILEAVKNLDFSLKYASERLRNDKEVVIAALKCKNYGVECHPNRQLISVLDFVGDSLKSDKEIIKLEELKKEILSNSMEGRDKPIKRHIDYFITTEEDIYIMIKKIKKELSSTVKEDIKDITIFFGEKKGDEEYIDEKYIIDEILENVNEEFEKTNPFINEMKNLIFELLKKEEIHFLFDDYNKYNKKFLDITIFKDNLNDNINVIVPEVYNPFFKLKSITLRYLFGCLKYDIKMDDSINIIHAPNGYGKSTLINCVFYFYNFMFDKLYALPFYELSFELENRKHLVLGRPGKSYFVKYSFINVKYSFINDSVKTIITNNNNITRITTQSTKYDSHLMKNEISKLGYKPGKTLNYIFNFDMKKMKSIKYSNDLWYKENINQFNRLIKKFFLEDKIIYIDNDDYILNDDKLINHLVIINNTDVVKEVPGVIKKGEKLDFDVLSSGEKYIIYVLSTLLFNNMKDYSLIILDEPELYLHVEWQQVLIDILREIVDMHKSNDADTNIRMLIATHSPYFMNAPDVKVGNPEYEEES